MIVSLTIWLAMVLTLSRMQLPVYNWAARSFGRDKTATEHWNALSLLRSLVGFIVVDIVVVLVFFGGFGLLTWAWVPLSLFLGVRFFECHLLKQADPTKLTAGQLISEIPARKIQRALHVSLLLGVVLVVSLLR